MRVVIATDSLDPALGARRTAEALAEGWRLGAPHAEVVALPMAGGGRGTLEVVAETLGGRPEVLAVAGAYGDARQPARAWLTPAGTAWLDPAEALGTLRDHGARTPLEPGAARDADPARLTTIATTSTSVGAGELLAAFAAAPRAVVTLGDLTAHDAGLGALAALGGARGRLAEVLTGGGLAAGRLTPEFDDDLTDVVATALGRLARTDVVVGTDTDEPLFGLHGVHANLARSTGVEEVAAQQLSTALGAAFARVERVLPAARQRAATGADLLARAPAAAPVPGGPQGRHDHAHGAARPRPGSAPGSGAGGGLAAMLELLGARVFSAADVVGTEVGLAAALEGADLVVTAVPTLDGGVMAFSVPATVGAAAQARAVPVVAIAREVRTSARELAPLGISATYPLASTRRSRGGAGVPVGDMGARGAADPEALAGEARGRAERLARTWSPAPR